MDFVVLLDTRLLGSYIIPQGPMKRRVSKPTNEKPVRGLEEVTFARAVRGPAQDLLQTSEEGKCPQKK